MTIGVGFASSILQLSMQMRQTPPSKGLDDAASPITPLSPQFFITSVFSNLEIWISVLFVTDVELANGSSVAIYLKVMK
tara:strand:- start:987 stop:1223 length:237 start_codon:yes stop_codon:yes gene_type:complete